MFSTATNIKKKLTITKVVVTFIIIQSFFFDFLTAQEIHFSQFYANALTENPANTAWYDGNLRVNCMYRTQWKAIDNKPYQTISLSAEKQFQFYDHSYGFGVQFLRDESGYVGLINDKLLASGAFAANVNGHSLCGGIQLGLVYKSTNINDYTFDEQFDLGGENVFNRDYNNGENEGRKIFHAAINAGVLWEKQLSKTFTAKAGFALFNINTPHESIYGISLDNTKQSLRVSTQFGGNLNISPKIDIEPNILFMRQEKSTDFLIGANVDYNLAKKTSVYFGTLFRYGFEKNYDASIWILGAKINRFDIGCSYDINLSSLKEATNNRGAFEISLTYLTPSWKKTKSKIPCERF
ncbi:MAG: PorP/SprF family type IX secretion system membrane protein [Bacteroidales bacterium]|nr:PorP/SprF family type IX secretion system membrane protein [Bacteroidales bacterium]